MSLFTYYDESEVETLECVFHKNYSMSDERRAQISIQMTGKKQSLDTVTKRAISNTGKKRTKEFCELQSKLKKNVGVGYRWYTPYGVFETSGLAAQAEGVDASTIRLRCDNTTSKKFSKYYKEKLDK